MKNKYSLIILSLITILGIGFFLYNEKIDTTQTIGLSQEAKNTIIQQALHLDLQIPSNLVSSKAMEFSDVATKKVHEGKYEEAIEITVDGLKQFPKDFNLQADLASLLGDTSEMTESPLKERMVARAKQLFDTLLEHAAVQPKNVYYPFMNEYFYRFKKYREQYELGLERVVYYWGTPEWEQDSNGYRGYYSQGVGAANYARELMKSGNRAFALDYAQKALVAWAQYFSYNNKYYNAYVHYALALGILGYKDQMMKALQKSAQIINKDLDYFEFKDVIDFVENLNKLNYYGG